MQIPLVNEMILAAQKSVNNLKKEIKDVRYGPCEKGKDESILFIFQNKQYQGFLRGRNRDLVLTSEPEIDNSIALRVILDGDSVEIN